LLAAPNVAAAVIEPVLGLLAGAGHRRRIVVWGGIVFACALLLIGLAWSPWVLLLGFVAFYPAAGAFVSLSQAALIDLRAADREGAMARWTVAGSVGVTIGPLVLTAAVLVGIGWRGMYLCFAVLTLPLVLLVRRHVSGPRTPATVREGVRGAWLALRSSSVLRWLAMLQAGDTMGDLLNGYIALYAVDVVGVGPVEAGLAVFALTVSGLLGDALLLPLLSRASGLSYLRVSAGAMLAVYPAFLLVPGTWPKLVPLLLIGLLRAGWYALPQAGLYGEIAESSSSILILSNVGSLTSAGIVLGFGFAAQAAGIGAAMWVLVLGPIALLALASGVPVEPRIEADSEI
jgi:MFS transporter, FSR family, fosmidomycin resistance protein